MLVRDWLKILAPTAALMLLTAGACDTELGAGECADPGASQKCQCSDGRSSTQTCDAAGLWGDCYCYVAGCGNGELDSQEECDDGNTESGDGCSNECISEGSSNNNGPGPGPGGGGTGASGGNPSSGGSSAGGNGGNAGGMGVGGGTGGLGGSGGN